ncbi:MAG: SDR family oxidoreductase [FCB group bacterium]|nr:SDR family oxidoreductase [FCB group bacterium]
MDLGLNRLPVLVMASSSGIGSGIALEFAHEGAIPILFARREEKLVEVQNNIEKETGIKARIYVGDITNLADIENLFELIKAEYGSLFALVNNTGGPAAGGFDKFNDDDWQKAFELTLLSYIRTIRCAVPLMCKLGSGRIVNNTSSSTKIILDNLLLSNTFRMGIVGLSKTLASELGPDNILVNVIGPGKIATDHVDYLDSLRAKKQNLPLDEYREKVFAGIPFGRYGETAEIARMVVFLCSKANTYVSGQNILVDGALVKAY